MQLQKLLQVIFKDENDIHHVVTDPGTSSKEISSQKSVVGVIYKCIHCSKSYKKIACYRTINCMNRMFLRELQVSKQDLITPNLAKSFIYEIFLFIC